MKYSIKIKMGLLLSLALLFGISSCENVLPVPSVTNGSGISSLSGKLIASPENVKATHGVKGAIIISWTPIANAKFYYIYKSNSPHDKYVQIDEAKSDASSIDLKVPAGTSGYFKVAAVDAFGNISDLSLAVYGTSLAVPLITSIEESLDTATVYWYMLNVNSESYLNLVRYNINCYNSDGSLNQTKTLSATTETLCTFENLNSATKYLYEVEAYIANAQDSVEKSLKLDSETAVNLIPKIAEFTVSEGDFTDGVELKIKLPEIGKILAENGKGGADTSSYENRPLYFKIQRQEKIEGNKNDRFVTVCDYLNFKGGQTQLIADNTKKEDYEDGSIWNDYTEGTEIIYKDTTAVRGIQYEYRVLSFIDCYCRGALYSSADKIIVTHDVKKAVTKTGWAAAVPRMIVSRGESAYVYEDETAENPVVKYKRSDSVEFSASWNDFNKSSNYSYLLYENHRKLKGDNNGNIDSTGTNSFVVSGNTCYFNSLEEINNFIRNFDYTEPDPQDTSDSANAASRGYYRYTLCIISKKVAEQNPSPNTDDTTVQKVYDASFIKVEDLSNIAITNGQGQAKSNIISVVNGYKDKAEISFDFEENGKYKLKRNVLIDNSDEIDISADSKVIELVVSGTPVPENGKSFTVTDNVAVVTDTDLVSGKRYSYSLFASNDDFEDNESMAKIIETLGTPSLVFEKEKADYNTITVKWNKVLQASKYIVKHNNKEWVVKASDLERTGEEVKFTDPNGEYEVICTNGINYSFIIKAIAIKDFDTSEPKTIMANKAGENLEVSVEAESCVNGETKLDSTTCVLNDVHVLGPALIGLNASEASMNDRITVEWNAIEGVSTYALRRQCPNVNDPENPRVDIFYVSNVKNGKYEVSSNGEPVSPLRMIVSEENSKIKLVDLHCAADDSTKGYQISQEQIAWGHEYIYSVTPVNDMEHNPFDSSFIVNYQNITGTAAGGTSKKGFASGYGLNVVASKSEYPDSIHITWESPNSKSTLKSHVWARPVGETEWKSLGIYSSGTTAIDVTLGKEDCSNFDRCARIEFAVNYEQNTTVNFKESYTKYLSEKGYVNSRGELTGNEPDNVGYEFTLPYFVAEKPVAGAETFTETVNWALWNSSNDPRKNAPGDGIEGDCYEIQIKNKNCSDKWYTIATVSKEGKVTSKASSISWADVTVSGDINYLTVTPNNMNSEDKVHDGILKVQRDYKHYYKIVAKRKNSSGDVVNATLGAFDSTEGVDETAKNEIFSYRKITDKEFVLGVCLIIADASYKSGVYEAANGEKLPVDESKFGCSGASGKFGLYHQSGTKTAYWGTKGDYQHIFYAMPSNQTETLTSGWSINVPGTGTRSSADGKKFYYFNPGNVSVKHETNMPSYQGSMTFTAGEHGSQAVYIFDGVSLAWKLSITSSSHGSYSYSANNETDFKKIFPFHLSCDNGSGYSSFDASLPVFKNLWWEVRD
ncbi:MAG: hypothetical protein KBT21_01650 [Treponema sp.]|nr:hypothetical protein [Candidatus Treponema merdequi]